MIIYVDAKAKAPGRGTKEEPFAKINDAARIAQPGDEVLVAPGLYREYVDPQNAGTEEQRIVYRSAEPLGAEITGAEPLTDWKLFKGSVWTAKVKTAIFGDYDPYATFVYGDWYFAGRKRHTGCVFMNDESLYEALTLNDCLEGKPSETSWEPEKSIYQWYSEKEGDYTVFYANFQDKDPNKEKVEFTVRRRCFFPSKTGVSYIIVSGFKINKAATTWAPPAAFQDGMIGPHWSKGWIIEDCDISLSKCAGICVGKYLDPENEHFFTYKHVKSPTQMERDAVCRGQYHGWLKERIGSHIIRRNHIHHCEQGGIIGRMGGVFSLIEDNHIHHINTMMELGGAEVAGIKMHAAIDVTIRRNHIHHCVMGIWTDWEAQGTRITQNLLHDNHRPATAKHLEGGMGSQDIFVEVGHGPTLIDNNILLSDVSFRMATEGFALVHNLIMGPIASIDAGCDGMVEGKLRQRYTPYHIPHRTEVMGFMTILHGDDRIYNNIFIKKDDYKFKTETGTSVFDEFPTYEEWIANFDMDNETPDMDALEKFHFRYLPVWAKGNVYLNGAKPWKKERNAIVDDKSKVFVELEEKDGKFKLKTNLYDLIKNHPVSLITTETLGKAFQPDQPFENPDGTPITFDTDFEGKKREGKILPGPFAGEF
jgi:hypothetical protein